MKYCDQNHYAALGLDRHCSIEQIRTAYRILAKAIHPDVNPSSPDAMARTQEINEAYRILNDPIRRRAYDDDLVRMEKENSKKRYRPAAVTINKDIFVGILDFLKGLTLSVSVLDPANMNGTEVYEFTMPPDTAPGSRFRLKRSAPFDTGFVIVRVKARPDARYKVRGFDVRCELKISTQRATLGGSESVRGVLGNIIRIHIPPHVARGEIISVPGEGMPKARGGRGDLLVRITYRPIVQISRTLNPRSLSRARLKATNA